MSTVRQSSGPGSRWWLAVLLALIIAAVVLGAIFLPRLTKKSSSPTATARVVVVTATPTPGSGQVTAVVTGTPATAIAGGSTPLPGATPVPTEPGLVLGMIVTPAHTVSHDQTGAASGSPQFSYYLDPRQVVTSDLTKYGFSPGFSITSPPSPSPSPTPHVGADHRPVIRFLVQYRGKTYTVAVAQPATQGPKGIWLIVTILPGKHLLFGP